MHHIYNFLLSGHDHNKVPLAEFPCAVTEVTTITLVMNSSSRYYIYSNVWNMVHILQYDVSKHMSPISTIWHAPSFPIFTYLWSPVVYDEKHPRSGFKWNNAPEWTTNVDWSQTRFSLFFSLRRNNSYSLVAIIEILFLFGFFFGSTPLLPPLSF